jgi:hypothetical protein
MKNFIPKINKIFLIDKLLFTLHKKTKSKLMKMNI